VPFSIPVEWQSAVILPPDSGVGDHRFIGNYSNAGARSRFRTDTLVPRNYSPVFKRSRMVELNAADTLELCALPAIGPFLARKIVEYREKLGGYFSTDQLLEVYRLTPGKLDTIRPYLVIDTSLVRRIDVNTVSLDALLKHPYLSRSQARGLLAYREKHGPFSQLADLTKCLLIDEITFEKMRDYVEVR
ncbi:MAG: ComEA family DNA-binding protein, partial [Flavobacteriales bacterium]